MSLTLAMTIAAAKAQGPPGGPGGFGGPGGPGGPSLVMAPEVQKELAFTTKQEAQIKRLAASMDRKRRELVSEAGAEGGDPRAMMSAMGSLQREVEASVTKSLNKRQKDRLAQLELQREGPLALARKEIAAKVKLTSAQSKKVKTIVDEMRSEMASKMPRPPAGGPRSGGEGDPATKESRRGGGRDNATPNRDAPGDEATGDAAPANGAAAAENGTPEARGGDQGGRRSRGAGGPPGGGGRPNFNSPEIREQFAKMREAVEKIRTTASEKINEILNPEQKTAYEKLLGKPFDFSKIRPGGPGGFGGGGFGPPRGPGGDGGAGSNGERRAADET